jgi:c-di-GMP-binding flagellar brake protein YcgR
MAEPRVGASFRNRRLQNRYSLPTDSAAAVTFQYPSPHGQRLTTQMRDISLSGLSMVLPDELAAIQAGDIVKGIEARIERKSFRGDLLVMHVSPANGSAAVCGGLFYPEGDEDLITIRLIVRALEAAAQTIS